jgi:hypothetical protein
MDRALPSSGEIWIHFKEKQYRIITLAEDAKTGESYGGVSGALWLIWSLSAAFVYVYE